MSIELGLIDYRMVQDGCLEQRGKVSHGRVLSIHGTQPPKTQPRKTLGIALADRHLRSVLADLDGVNRELPLLAMELQLEAVGEQFTDHNLNLILIRHTVLRGLPVDIVVLAVEPGRRAHNLLRVHAIYECHKKVGRRIDGDNLAAAHREAPALCTRITRLDGADVEL